MSYTDVVYSCSWGYGGCSGGVMAGSVRLLVGRKKVIQNLKKLTLASALVQASKDLEVNICSMCQHRPFCSCSGFFRGVSDMIHAATIGNSGIVLQWTVYGWLAA